MSRLIKYALLGGTLIAGTAGGEQAHDDAVNAARKAADLTPDLDNGREVYRVCAVCHAPEGWGSRSGYYPQIAGQHTSVIIKQIVDILSRNRDTPTMFPFTVLENLSPQELADVAAYLQRQPMTADNGVGPGTDLEHGKKLYEENCVDCHGAGGEGKADDGMPLIQGQHYKYLVRQFQWIRDGKRRNADKEMMEQIQGFDDRDIAAIMDYTSRLKPPLLRVVGPEWRNPDFPAYVRAELGE
jgi:cytochrome c553